MWSWEKRVGAETYGKLLLGNNICILHPSQNHADTRAALPCQLHFSPPPPVVGSRPCQQPGSCPQEKGRHIYISLTPPRLSDSSLLLAPAGLFTWTVFRMEGRKGGGTEGHMVGWAQEGKAVRTVPSPTDNLSDQNVTRELQTTADNVGVWLCPRLHPGHLHSTYTMQYHIMSEAAYNPNMHFNTVI